MGTTWHVTEYGISQVLMHVSTTYSQADKPDVEEKIYPCEVDWKRTIKIAENIDERMLGMFTAK